MYIKIGPETGVEAFNGAGGAVTLAPKLLHLLKQRIGLCTEACAEQMVGAEQLFGVSLALPTRATLIEFVEQLDDRGR